MPALRRDPLLHSSRVRQRRIAAAAAALGSASLIALGATPAHAVSPASEPPASIQSPPADCQHGWDLVDPATKQLRFELSLLAPSVADEFRGLALQFDQAARNASEAGELPADDADRWGIGVGFGYDLPYLDLTGATPLVRNADGTLSKSEGGLDDGRRYAFTLTADDGHTVYFDDRGQALADHGPLGGTLRLYYVDADQLQPGSRVSLLERIMTPAGQTILAQRDGERSWLVDAESGDFLAEFTPGHGGNGRVWSAQAGLVGDAFLNWEVIEGRTQLGSFECRRADLTYVKTAFTYAPAFLGRTVDDVTVTEY